MPAKKSRKSANRRSRKAHKKTARSRHQKGGVVPLQPATAQSACAAMYSTCYWDSGDQKCYKRNPAYFGLFGKEEC
jgi:hypothetical protein